MFETLTGTGRSTLHVQAGDHGHRARSPATRARLHGGLHRSDVQHRDRDRGHRSRCRSNATSAAAIVNGMAWTYSVTGATSYIDGVNFSVNYTFVARAPTGVLSAHPFVQGSATTDAVLSVAALATTDRPVLAVHGTVYAPKAAVSFVQTGVANDLVDRGVVAREVYLGLASPSNGLHRPPPVDPRGGHHDHTSCRGLHRLLGRRGPPAGRGAVHRQQAAPSTGLSLKVLTWSLQ